MTSPDMPATPARRTARVPVLVGVAAIDAHDRALDAGVLAVAENAFHTAAGHGRVNHQVPDPDTEVERGTIVRIWISS